MKERDSMILYRSFYEAIIELPESNQLEIMKAIFEYGFDGVEPNLSGLSKTIWILVKPNLEANRRKWENGCQPKQKQTKSKAEAKQKQTRSKTEGNVYVDVDVEEEKDVEEKENDSIGGTKKFVVPTIEEVAKYVKSKHPLATNDKVLEFAEKFWSHYENKNWNYSGNKKMKNWHLAIPQWKETIEKTLYQSNNGYKAPLSPPKKKKVRYFNINWPDRINLATSDEFELMKQVHPEGQLQILSYYED